jgi:hypothetical protein
VLELVSRARDAGMWSELGANVLQHHREGDLGRAPAVTTGTSLRYKPENTIVFPVYAPQTLVYVSHQCDIVMRLTPAQPPQPPVCTSHLT